MTARLVAVPELQSKAAADGYDATVIVHATAGDLDALPCAEFVRTCAAVDKSLHSAVTLLHAPTQPAPFGPRLVLSPTGALSLEMRDDVRKFAAAAKRGISRALQAGSTRPLLIVAAPKTAGYEHAVEIAALGALQELYEPLETVEWAKSGKCATNGVTHLGLATLGAPVTQLATTVDRLNAMEEGRVVARDICGSDPERMAPLKAAAYLERVFAGVPNVTIKVITDPAVLLKDYPLFAAVARASMKVPRHHPAVVQIDYKSPNQANVAENLFLVGKGVCYDTGGADVKTGGAMRGMSRDKGGAAAVAGFLKTVGALQPNTVNVSASLAFVRNSVGSDAYVSDEIIVSRAGLRVLVGNTDAEGRMAMADLLAEMGERALAKQKAQAGAKCHLFTCATLTGHVIRAYGPYPACMDNGPARSTSFSQHLASVGAAWGEPWEVSTLRAEDYAIVRPKSNREDVIQCNTAPSTMTSRGHQFPAVFMMIASGINKYGLDEVDAAKQLRYTHLDIAGAAEEEMTGSGSLAKCTGAPVVSLTATFAL